MMAAHIMQVMIGLAASIILARIFTRQELGAYLMAGSFFAMGGFAALPGMSTALMRGVLKGNESAARPILARSLACTVLAGGAFVIAGYALKFFGVSLITANAFMAAGLALPISTFDKYDIVLQGRRQFYASRIILLLGSISSFIMIALTAYFTRSVGAAFFMFALSSAIRNAIGWWVVLRGGLKAGDEVNTGELLKQGWQQTGYEAVNPVIGQMDRVILGSIDPALLAVYHVGAQVPRQVKDNAKAILSVPLAHWSALNKLDNIERLSRHGWKIMMSGALLSLSICAVAPFAIPLLYGDAYSASIIVAIVLSLPIGMRLLGNMYWSVDQYQNKGRAYGMNVIISKSIYMICLLILVPYFDITGAMVSLLLFDAVQFLLGYSFYRKERSGYKTMADRFSF